MTGLLNPEKLDVMAKELFKEERARKRLDGWFFIKEIRMKYEDRTKGMAPAQAEAYLLKKQLRSFRFQFRIMRSLPEHNVMLSRAATR